LTFGIKGGELLRNLASWGTPENVIETVREWIREYSRLYVLAADFIVVCDQKTSSQLSSFQPLMGMMEPVEAYSVFRIKRGNEKEVRELLEEMGFDPRVPEQPASDPVPEVIHALEGEYDPEYELLFDLQEKKEEQTRSMKTGKYSEELKALDLNEIHHVIHYALLMGYQLKFEYAGSPHIKRGEYTVTPVSVTADKEPALEAKKNGEAVKKYYIQRIVRIGVKST
jgi:ribulose bisphosphate carboxylase small subunit